MSKQLISPVELKKIKTKSGYWLAKIWYDINGKVVEIKIIKWLELNKKV